MRHSPAPWPVRLATNLGYRFYAHRLNRFYNCDWIIGGPGAARSPGGGEVRLSLEREPSFFAAAGIEGDQPRTVVAEEHGRIVCTGSVSSRVRYVNGGATRVGYLGGLRLHARCRNRFSIILRGFQFFRGLHAAGGAGIYLTSIAADNVRAWRLLERGLPGMPTYHFVGEIVTLVVRARRSRRRRQCERALRLECGTDSALPDVVQLQNQSAAEYQFCPMWSAEDLSTSRCPGLAAADFRIVRSADGVPIACAALWDQRPVKQAVVRGYSSRLGRLRPLINLAAVLSRCPRLPAPGQQIRHAFVSHLAAARPQPGWVELLINELQEPARSRGIDFLTLAFDARDGRVAHLRREFRPREYRSRLYAVHFDEQGAATARGLDGWLLAPEVALL